MLLYKNKNYHLEMTVMTVMTAGMARSIQQHLCTRHSCGHYGHYGHFEMVIFILYKQTYSDDAVV